MFYDVPFSDGSPRVYRKANSFVATDIEVLEVGYNKVPPSKKQLMQRDAYIIHYVTGGKGTFMDLDFDNKCIYTVVPGEVERTTADAEEPYECCWIMFRGALAERFLINCGIPLHNSVLSFNKNAECAEIIKKALYQQDYKSSMAETCVLQSAFYELMALHTLNKPAKLVGATAQNIADFIQMNYHHRFKISQLAEKFHYTRNHLFVLFKREFGIWPLEYLINVRLDKAKMFLINEEHNLSIKEISDAVGFEDPLYFSRLFRKRTGMSPTEYKKCNK